MYELEPTTFKLVALPLVVLSLSFTRLAASFFPPFSPVLNEHNKLSPDHH